MRGVLAVGAHPGDIEAGCGGTLADHRSAAIATLSAARHASWVTALPRPEHRARVRYTEAFAPPRFVWDL